MNAAMSIIDFIKKILRNLNYSNLNYPPPPKKKKCQNNGRKQNRQNKTRFSFFKADSNKEPSSECVICARVCPYRGHLHHLQLYVLWLWQASSCLRHWDVLDPLEIPLCCAVVCVQGLGQLRHGLGQQIGRLGGRQKLMNIGMLPDVTLHLPSNL